MTSKKNTGIASNETLTHSQRLQLADVAKDTGFSIQDMMRRAVGNWLVIEAPVYLAYAKGANGQRV